MTIAANRSRLPRRRQAAALCLERLEDRTLLSQQGLLDYRALLADPSAYDPTRILVRFRPGVSAANLNQQILPGSTLGAPISLVPGAHSVRLPAGVTVPQALALFQASPLVQYAEPNGIVRAAETIPNDTDFGRLYGMRNTGQGGGTAGADVKASLAWDVATGGTRIAVANIDTGVDYNHPDLYLNIWVNQREIPATRLANLTDTDGDTLITFWDLNDPTNQGPFKITDQNSDGRITGADILAPMQRDGSGADLGSGGWADTIDQDGLSYVDDLVGWNFAATSTNNPNDNFGHGTHCAGTHSGLGNNNLGVAGVTWKAQIGIVKFLGSGGGGSWEDAALAVSYAANMGFPMSTNSWGGTGFSQVLLDALTAARTRGHLFVAAAGNGSSNNDTSNFYPANYMRDLDNVISVAATDNRDQKAGFSNFGRATVHLGAPGVAIYSTVPTGTCSLCDPSGYDLLDGTSMATPHVAGAALLLWNLFPHWDYLQVKEQLLATVDPIPALATNTITGGRLNVDAALGLIAAGPRIVGTTPNGNSQGPLSSLRVSFDRTVLPDFFTTDDIVSFTGPNGAITVTNVTVVPGSSDTRYDLSFDPQGRTGPYSIVIGPDIYDFFGNAMDQDRDGTVGEPIDDRFTGRFGLLGPRVTSPANVGTLGSPVTSVRVTFSTPMNPATFTPSDVFSFTGPGGAIAVTGVVPVAGSNDTQYELQFAGQGRVGTYTLVFGPDVRDTFDNPMDQDNDLTPGETPADRFTLTFTVRGARVISQLPSSGAFDPISTMRVTFNASMDPATFTLADIVSFTGPNGAIPVDSIAAVPGTNNRTFEITFALQTSFGVYTMVMGPDIRDTFGGPMDQNDNLIGGEVPADRYTARYELASPCRGPDAVGSWGCVFPFVDYSIFGLPDTFTILAPVDDSFAPVDLGTNTFWFYGTMYTGANRLFVSSNGLITFGSGTSEYTNGDLTSGPVPAAIAVLWDDWIKSGSEPMVVGRFEDYTGDSVPDRLVIEWYKVMHYSSSPRVVTFQAHLYLNLGQISLAIVNYFDLDTGDATRQGASATLGIKRANPAGTSRVLMSANALSPYIGSSTGLFFFQMSAGPGGSPGSAPGQDPVGGQTSLTLEALENEAPAPTLQEKLRDTAVTARVEERFTAPPKPAATESLPAAPVWESGLDWLDDPFALSWMDR